MTTLSALKIEMAPAQLDAEMALGDRLRHLDVCALLADALPGTTARGIEPTVG